MGEHSQVVCLVTIHGIGFQQPPLVGVPGYPDTPGYADDLHANLSKHLDETMLGDDPQRQRSQHGQNGPIYVQSVWPPDSHCREAGLRRLGTWDNNHSGIIIGPEAQLTDGQARLSHIALVYSQLEEQGPQIGAALIASSMALLSLGHYTNVTNLIRMTFLDTEPQWQHLLPQQTQSAVTATPNLRIRQDPGFKLRQAPSGQQQHPIGFMATLRQLENDVAAYVCHNEMRERVRGFVLDALMRLACREDVAGIVINSHSNGTIIALDILHKLPPFAARKILALITAGSPLRKYTDLFIWGKYMATIPRIGRWINFVDPKDPVADPLAPCADWVRGTSIDPSQMTGLMKALDPNTGEIADLHIEDCTVDNLANSRGGGLQAHNYWDNDKEFVQPLAGLLKQASNQLIVT